MPPKPCIHAARPSIPAAVEPTAAPDEMYDRFPRTDYFIRGESEFVLAELAGLYALSAVNMALAISLAVVWVLVFQSGSHTEGINNP